MNDADIPSTSGLSFSSIYQEHFPMIFRFGFRLLGDSEQAMDLSQEVFLRFHAALDGRPPVLDIKAWLYRTAANLGYDWLRRKSRYSRLLHSGFEVGGAAQDIESDLIRSEDDQAVRASLDRLSPKDRLLLILYAEGLRYREIAGVMGLRESSVGTLIARAVQKLSREFRQGGSR